MNFPSTVKLLIAWGRWGAIDVGYPRACPMFTLKARSPLYAAGYIPPDVLDMERAVGAIEPQERRILVLRFQWRARTIELANLLRINRITAWRRLNDAIGSAHVSYCNYCARETECGKTRYDRFTVSKTNVDV